jgi:GTP pyrophosphokinase
MQEDKQTKIASETYIYAPLAHRLGLYNIKTKLEDLGLKYTEKQLQ